MPDDGRGERQTSAQPSTAAKKKQQATQKKQAPLQKNRAPVQKNQIKSQVGVGRRKLMEQEAEKARFGIKHVPTLAESVHVNLRTTDEVLKQRDIRESKGSSVSLSLSQPPQVLRRPAPAEKKMSQQEADERKRRLAEADQLHDAALKLANGGKRAEAIAMLKKRLAIQREVLGEASEDIPQTLGVLAMMGPMRFERRLLAFVLRHSGSVALVRLGPAPPITEAVRKWERARVEGRADEMQAAAATLEQRVWGKLRSHLNVARMVLVAPDGALTFFPFAALPGSRPGSYLVEELTIGYVASGRQLLRDEGGIVGGRARAAGRRWHRFPGRSWSPTIFRTAPRTSLRHPQSRSSKGTDSPRCRAPSPRPVPCSEVFHAAFADQPAELLTGAAASESELKRRLDGGHVRVVHLATHGFFESPARIAALRAEIRG